MGLLTEIYKRTYHFLHELSKYPSVRSAIWLCLSTEAVKFSQIRDIAYKTERNILTDITLFDVYESDRLVKTKNHMQ